MPDKIILIVGASGSGKTTISSVLERRYGVKQLISYTTREQRENEVDGEDYYFIKDKKDIYQLYELQENSLEYTEYQDNLYGLFKTEIHMYDNPLVSFVCTREGAETIMKEYGEKAICFWLQTEKDTMIDRMVSRGDSFEEAYLRYWCAEEFGEFVKPDFPCTVLDSNDAIAVNVKKIINNL